MIPEPTNNQTNQFIDLMRNGIQIAFQEDENAAATECVLQMNGEGVLSFVCVYMDFHIIVRRPLTLKDISVELFGANKIRLYNQAEDDTVFLVFRNTTVRNYMFQMFENIADL
jgi:hypothetical protein